MPNWCSNNLEVTGPVEKVRALWDAAQKDEEVGGGLLQALRPMPADLKDTTSPSEGPNWYDWRVTNWGTKWEVSNEGLEFSEIGNGLAQIIGHFESAWAPPTRAFAQYGYENEDVKVILSYYEPGMQFVGRFCVEQGEEDDEYYEYGEESSDTVRDVIGADLDDEWNISEELAEYEDQEDD
jgi:hypothetical protein